MSTRKRNESHRYFGPYGGRFVPEMLIPALDELENAYIQYRDSSHFKRELESLFQSYAGRPTPLYKAENLARSLGLAKVYLKLEGLAHTGAHKINNALGQALLAKKMGKKVLIAETGAGQHGLATATVAAKFGMGCKVFMGAVDIKRQYPNVFAMKLLGAEVVPVEFGTRTLKDAVNAALKYWIEHLQDSHYLLGSALGPHPYPTMVRDFQSVIGMEVKTQIMRQEKQLPDVLIACVGGGSNAMGLFSPFLNEVNIRFFGVEAGGRGYQPGENAIRLGSKARVGTVQGYRSYFLQDASGQVLPTHSISAGLDYAGIGPELAFLYDTHKISFDSVTDLEALAAFQLLAAKEGIIPAMESSHAVAFTQKIAGELPADAIVVVNVSGRGDKDLFITARHLDADNWHTFLKGEVNETEPDR